MAERLTVAQEVAGSIPVAHPIPNLLVLSDVRRIGSRCPYLPARHVDVFLQVADDHIVERQPAMGSGAWRQLAALPGSVSEAKFYRAALPDISNPQSNNA